MLHFINPNIDCVFKAILASPGNEGMLANFLNNTLRPFISIKSVEVLNPYNEREFDTDKLSVVDIKATDSAGVTYQIEVQLGSPEYLAKRMLYTWASVYKKQIKSGDDYNKLTPVISIWLLSKSFFPEDEPFFHFQMYDMVRQKLLTDQCSIHVIQLDKWRKPKALQEGDSWLYFFKEAKQWKELPQELARYSVMRQAMQVLNEFSDKKEAYFRYQAREEAMRIKQTDETLLREARIEAENAKARAESEAVRAENEAARAEKAEVELATAEALAKKAQAEFEVELEKERAKLRALMDKMENNPNS